MKLAMCPACRTIHEAVGPEAMAGLGEEQAYSLTHCRLCETPSEHFRALPDRPALAEGEFGYPKAVVPVRPRTYARYRRAAPMLRIGFVKEGLPACMASELAEDLRMPLKEIAVWIGTTPVSISRRIEKDERLSLGEGERLLVLARMIGQVEIASRSAGEVPGLEPTQWMAQWLAAPNDELGGSCPPEFMDTGEGRELLVGLIDQMWTPPAAEPRPREIVRAERVEAIVTVLIPEFELVHLVALDGSGNSLSIGEGVDGVDWRELRLGQRLMCDVEGEHSTRVTRAEILSQQDAR